MATRRPTVPAPVPPPVWGRGKLLAVLAAAVVAALGLVTGLALAVAYALTSPDPSPAGSGPVGQPTADRGPSNRDTQRDALADEPMPSAGAEAALPGPVSTRNPGVIELPRATGAGPAGVPTGFPRTPEGALAQLASIDVTAMQTGSLDGVRRVIEAWAAPGGPTGETWSGVHGMAGLLSAADLSGAGSPQLAIVVRPAMGLIKGTVGPDFAVVCVDFEFTVTVEATSRIAIADCQRMTWADDRWLIGPGPEPAPAPSVWPGTDLAIEVGYQDLRYG
ncbi:hypothetical protein SAMN05216574_107165 [Blastococcus tunisiensis]|uniref:Uncharacterized protein n=2 Tax=Blastococcus tunisiensis TaxID=1798228 RepID=A0A1I2ER50_9ACTN|nr:hypothetical protein SAMN05216574_107165 [Blastococcus sp. DSM 46838]